MTNCHGPGAPRPLVARMSGTLAGPVTNFENHVDSALAKLACPLLVTGELMRIPRALALILSSLLAVPSAVAAQTAPTQGLITANVTAVTIGDDPVENLTNQTLTTRGFSLAECDVSETVEIEIQLGTIPAGITYVDAWIGDANKDCSTEAARQTGMSRTCKNLDVNPATNGTATSAITILLSDLADLDGSLCDSTVATGETYRLWLLATNSTETTGPITTAQYVYVTFKVDVTPPTAPTPESANESGDSSIPVSWSASTAQGVLTFNLYVDATVTSCSEDGQWSAGEAPPSDQEPNATSTGTSGSVNSSSAGLEIGESALVYITALDPSKNESALSTPVCVTRMQTGGFCDALAAEGEECTDTCAAALPTTRTTSSAIFLGLAFVALAVRRRKR